MSDAPYDATFLDCVPTFTAFAQITDPGLYVPVPDGWTLGVADIVDSSRAIEAGRYKVVNVAGVAVISAVSNALGHGAFPFVFGGDGASFAVPPAAAAIARAALAETAAFVREDFGLELRIAAVPVGAIRAAGFDLRVARFAPSPDVTYAVFTGGGLTWAEAEVKAGAFAIEEAPPGSRPDLSGLSCRFDPMTTRHGLVLSLIARPVGGSDTAAYRTAITDLLTLIEHRGLEAASPVPAAGPHLGFPPSGVDVEARAHRKSGERLATARIRFAVRSSLAWLVFRLGLRVGRFEPTHYVRRLVANSDYRKYDDGLRMTIDCSPALATDIERRLASAAEAGVLAFGLHRQDAALMTCFTPSVYHDDHIHFIDGAAGGYASAAASLKARAA